MNDYAAYRQGLPVDASPGTWAAHYGPDFLGSLSSPTISPQAIYWLCVPFGFSHDVTRTEVVWEAAPFVFGASLEYEPLPDKVRVATWQTTMNIADDGTISFNPKIVRPLGLPRLDALFTLISQRRLIGRTYPYSEAVLAAVKA